MNEKEEPKLENLSLDHWGIGNVEEKIRKLENVNGYGQEMVFLRREFNVAFNWI